jgi:hypothetical protein
MPAYRGTVRFAPAKMGILLATGGPQAHNLLGLAGLCWAISKSSASLCERQPGIKMAAARRAVFVALWGARGLRGGSGSNDRPRPSVTGRLWTWNWDRSWPMRVGSHIVRRPARPSEITPLANPPAPGQLCRDQPSLTTRDICRPTRADTDHLG